MASIKENISTAIEKGQFVVGEECTGTVLCKYIVNNEEMEEKTIEVHGRQVGLMELRRRLIEKHEHQHLMRDHNRSLEEYLSMERADIIDELSQINEYDRD